MHLTLPERRIAHLDMDAFYASPPCNQCDRKLAGKLEGIKQKRPERRLFVMHVAERVGFEPTVGLHLRLISSQVHSTTLPPLRRFEL